MQVSAETRSRKVLHVPLSPSPAKAGRSIAIQRVLLFEQAFEMMVPTSDRLPRWTSKQRGGAPVPHIDRISSGINSRLAAMVKVFNMIRLGAIPRGFELATSELPLLG